MNKFRVNSVGFSGKKTVFALKIMWQQPKGALDSWSFLFFILNSTLPCLWMWGNTLQKCQGITHSVRLVSCKRRWVYRRIDVHDFLERERKRIGGKKRLHLTLRPHNSRKKWTDTDLQQGRNGATGVPEHWCQVWNGLAFLAKLQQCIFSGLWTGQLIDPLVNLLTVHLGQGCDVSYSL